MKKHIAILGSTGSIGTQALDVVSAHPDLFKVEVLTANNNVDLLVDQVVKYQPNAVVIGNESKYKELSVALEKHPVKVYAGLESVSQVVEMEGIDIVLTALVGYAGLDSTIRALKAKKHIALANKETMVVAGELVSRLAIENRVHVLPVDSEHSAIFQCLIGEVNNAIEKIILTASGGPFREWSLEEMERVSLEQALNHPNWCMGNKITIDSASLMNKGLEAIEAKWLFDIRPNQIEVIIHPQSIIHSLVQFEDGSMKAQLGLPDMRLPIQYALGFPRRIKNDFPRFDFLDYPELNFKKPDLVKFKNLALAFHAMEKGGNMPCILNAANEVAVDLFLHERIGFMQMSGLIEKTMEKATFVAHPGYNDYKESDGESREIAQSFIRS
jgi:1-deoxy-D-xylulose-5-phosphate reductoisomerase